MRSFLQKRDDGQAEHRTRSVFPDVDGRVFRRYRFGTWDCMAMRRFVEPEKFFGIRTDPEHAGSFDSVADAPIDRPGDHSQVFTWMLEVLAKHGLVNGKTVGIDGTTLEANAAMRSIVRRDTGESYTDFLTKLAKASGIETPTREDLAKLDRNRAKKGSNEEWVHPDDPDAKIAKMKDGRTHLAHKAEHAVDMETGAVLAVTLQDANVGDTTTIQETLIAVAKQMEKLSEDSGTAQQIAPNWLPTRATTVTTAWLILRRAEFAAISPSRSEDDAIGSANRKSATPSTAIGGGFEASAARTSCAFAV